MTFVIWVLPDIVLEFRVDDPEGCLSEDAIAALIEEGRGGQGLDQEV